MPPERQVPGQLVRRLADLPAVDDPRRDPVVDLAHVAAAAVLQLDPDLGPLTVRQVHRHPRGPPLAAHDHGRQQPAPGPVRLLRQGPRRGRVVRGVDAEGSQHRHDGAGRHDDVAAAPVVVLGRHAHGLGQVGEHPGRGGRGRRWSGVPVRRRHAGSLSRRRQRCPARTRPRDRRARFAMMCAMWLSSLDPTAVRTGADDLVAWLTSDGLRILVTVVGRGRAAVAAAPVDRPRRQRHGAARRRAGPAPVRSRRPRAVGGDGTGLGAAPAAGRDDGRHPQEHVDLRHLRDGDPHRHGVCSACRSGRCWPPPASAAWPWASAPRAWSRTSSRASS